MNRPIRPHLSRLVAGLALAAAATLIPEPAAADPGAFPMSITDARGTTLRLAAPPRRVVSLSPSLTEILFAVGSGELVRGVTTYCNYPREALEREKIGGFSARTISVEKIVSLEPDIVFASLSRHASIIETLEEYGYVVLATDSVSVDDTLGTIELIGAVTGNRAAAVELVDTMRARIAAVTDRSSAVPESERPRVFWEVFDEPLMTAGPSTFIGQLISLAGGRNVFADVSESWPQISREQLLERDPEVLMSSESHGEKLTEEAVRSRTGWSAMSAVKSGRIYLFDGDIVSRPGPRIVDALEMIAAALYPDQF